MATRSPVWAQALQAQWRNPTGWRWILSPVSLLYLMAWGVQRSLYALGLKRVASLPVPTVVVGNIHVGGAGKTPTTLYLASALVALGWRVGIISRGYGANHRHPRPVLPESTPEQVGDEPLLLAATACPVWVGQDRVATAHALLAAHPHINLLLCDDGLQHAKLPATLRICVMDGTLSLQNRSVLPMGPLREPWWRLNRMDAVVFNHIPRADVLPTSCPTFTLTLQPDYAWQVADPSVHRQASAFQGHTLSAVAGIANPARFAQTLRDWGVETAVHGFPDHHRFEAHDFDSLAADIILLTEKDAVKCRQLNNGKLWALHVSPVVTPNLAAWVHQRLSA